MAGEVLSFHLCSASVTQKWYPLSAVHLYPATCCHPSCRIGELSAAKDEDFLSGVSGGVIVDMMLGLLLSFQRFTMSCQKSCTSLSQPDLSKGSVRMPVPGCTPAC